MCGIAITKLKNQEITLFLGYYPGTLTIGNLEIEEDKPDNRVEMRKLLEIASKEELIELLFNFVDNAEEG